MNSLILLKSVHHQNTAKIAQVLSKTLKAKITDPNTFNPKDLVKYNLIGFGSGIYMWQHHKSLFSLINELPKEINKKAFIFSTSGVGQMGIADNHKLLRTKLQEKNFTIIGEFTCPGWDTFGPFKLIGGLNKKRPNQEDFDKAEKFAKKLLKII